MITALSRRRSISTLHVADRARVSSTSATYSGRLLGDRCQKFSTHGQHNLLYQCVCCQNNSHLPASRTHLACISRTCSFGRTERPHRMSFAQDWRGCNFHCEVRQSVVFQFMTTQNGARSSRSSHSCEIVVCSKWTSCVRSGPVQSHHGTMSLRFSSEVVHKQQLGNCKVCLVASTRPF